VHEASIAASLISSLEEVVKREGAKRAVKVLVRVGKGSGIVIDSFKFSFDALKKNSSALSEALLVVEEVPLLFRCNECSAEFEREDFIFPTCPSCGSFSVSQIAGEELEVISAELEF